MSLIERAGALDVEFRELHEQSRFRQALEPATEVLNILRELPSDAVPDLGAEITNASASLVNLYVEFDEPDQAVEVASEMRGLQPHHCWYGLYP